MNFNPPFLLPIAYRAENLRFLRDLLPNWGAGLIIYNGSEVKTLGEKIYALPGEML